MPLLLVQVEGFGQIAHIAVDAHAHEPRLARAIEHLFVFALAPPHLWREYLYAAALRQGKHGVDYLLNRLALHRAAALVAVGMPGAREQQPQVVVYLGYRPHRRARVVRYALLVNGYGGRKPLYVVNVWLVHTPQELARVG